MSDTLSFRRPTDADHPRMVAQVDDWLGGRHLHDLLPRLWVRHFAGTSWLAEDPAGAPVGFLIGFISPDHPEEAHIHMMAVSPNHRRSGLATTLYERFIADVEGRGVRRVNAITWPRDRISVAFHEALGFHAIGGPGTQRLYGTVAHPDYDYPGDDRVVFIRDLDDPSAGG